MTTSTRLWFVAFVVMVFAIGAAAGVVLDRAWLAGPRGPGMGRAGGPLGPFGLGGPPDRLLDELDRRLALTPDQHRQIAAILEERRPALQKLQDEARRGFIDAQQSLIDAIAAVLTEEQAARLKALSAPGRGGPGGRGGRGRGGPPRHP